MAKTSMYAIDRSEEYLAHYGIKGMKWGVRKAIASGGTGLGNRRLARQYRKAQKKLAKLEKRANNGAKYARRAAALGAGAAAAGGLAALGTKGVVDVMGNVTRGTNAVGRALMNTRGSNQAAHKMRNLGVALTRTTSNGGAMTNTLGKAAASINKWGQSNTLAKRGIDALGGIERGNQAVAKALMRTRGNNQVAHQIRNAGVHLSQNSTSTLGNAAKSLRGVSNNAIARAGAAALGAGLAGAAGYNAYRAATTKRAAKKAAEFRKEMNKTFAGTAYGQKSSSNAGGAKKRRRRR